MATGFPIIFGGGARGPWTPAQLQTALWLDAADASTVTLNGSTVSQWSDKSGNGRNATQSTAASQPAYAALPNLLVWSEQFQQAAWQLNAATIQANQTTAPDSTLTADKLLDSTVNTAHYTLQFFPAVTGATYTFSVYAKAAERSFIGVQFGSTGFANEGIAVNLTTGATQFYNGGTIGSALDVGNGWWRIQVSATATGTGGGVLISVNNAQASQFYAGTGTSGIFIWGAQINEGVGATTYQRTESAPALQINSVPTISCDGTNDAFNVDGSLFAGTPYTLTWVAARTSGKANNYMSGGTGSTNANLLAGWNQSANYIFSQIGNDLNYGVPAYTVPTPTLITHQLDTAVGRALFFNGTNVANLANTATLTSNNGWQIGSWGGAVYFSGVFGEVIATRYALPTADRQRIEGYLAWKWGLVASLPANHPYKLLPPTA